MASSPFARSGKTMRKMESKKSYSWWWDSHISPKNSKWLSENLEEMDRSVKRMLKLIEEDGDSFAKKAQMYYQKRPELIAHVEEFYRMYRSLAERYDNVTGELRKSASSDLQSQGSGISDLSSDLPSPEHKLGRRKTGPRAAGFDVFLGAGGRSADMHNQEGDDSSSLTDSESESDASSVNNYIGLFGNGGDSALNNKLMELENELRETKEKLLMQQDENADNSLYENNEDLLARIGGYEQELRIANERVRSSEQEITRLKTELEKFSPSELTDGVQAKDNTKFDMVPASEVQGDHLLQSIMEELRITKIKLQDSEKNISNLRSKLEDDESKSSDKLRHLQDQLESAKKEVNTLKIKHNTEKREVSKLQERISRLKASLSDRDHEIRDLKIAVSDAEQKIFPEKAQIKAEISKLLEERTCLQEQIKECESQSRFLEEEIRKIRSEKADMEDRFNREIEGLKTDIDDRCDEIEKLHRSLDASRVERNELNAKILKLEADLSSKDGCIDKMNQHLHQLHLEQAEMMAGAEATRKLVEELMSRAKELEGEVERQRHVISEGAEEKREAIRQLCFSLEHYRDGYQRLRQVVIAHKRVPLLAS